MAQHGEKNGGHVKGDETHSLHCIPQLLYLLVDYAGCMRLLLACFTDIRRE